MLLLSSLFALLLSSSFTRADKMSWTPCDAGLTAFEPSSVVLTPDPPVIGSPATFVISGNIGNELQGGSVDMTVSFSGLPIYSSTSDLCTKTTCPVPAGPIAITIVQVLPPIAPPGDYGLQVVARGPDGSELACVNVAFSLVLPSTSRTSSTNSIGSGSGGGTGGAAGSVGAEEETGVVVAAAERAEEGQLSRKQRMGRREVA